MTIVSNAGPILSFARAGRLDLLQGVLKEALQLGVDYFGSLRVLKDAKDRGFIREIKPILDELVAAGTYVSDELYHKFLRDVGEEQASP